MKRPLATTLTIVTITALAASGCASTPKLAKPPANFKGDLVSFLQSATLDPAPASAPVVALVYTFPKAGKLSSPLELRPVHQGKLPPWTSLHPMGGTQALSRPGLYVGVLSIPKGTIRYLARVADPRDVRGEALSPAGTAFLVRLSGGTYAARVPFVPDALAVGFEVSATNAIGRVQFALPLGLTPPAAPGRRYQAVID